MRQIGFFRWILRVLSLTALLIIFSLSFFPGCGGYRNNVSAGTGVDNSTDDVTYLAQYGTWIDMEPYGSVWVPSVSPDWRPFTYGHWVWSDAGWAWVSYEPYGWLVYHYGNWGFAPDIGWFWIEGSEWSPAPVRWLDYDGYCSWAPLPPPGVEWEDPWLESGFDFWVVVRIQDFDRENVGQYRIGRPPHPRNVEKESVSREPIGIHDVEKITGHTIKPQTLKHGPAPVYMNPRFAAPHREAQPHETRPEEKPSNQMSPHQAEESLKPSGQTGTQQKEGESAKTPETTPAQAEKSPAKGHEGTPPPSAGQPEQTPAGQMQPVHLHRMILTKDDDAKVRKYAPQVEREVLVPKDNSNQPQRRTTQPKKKR
jgi:hypothetical protein